MWRKLVTCTLHRLETVFLVLRARAECVVLVPPANKSLIRFSVVLLGPQDFQLSSAYLAVVAVALYFNQDHFCPTAPSIIYRTEAMFPRVQIVT